jgi:capsular polysaccharide export protein
VGFSKRKKERIPQFLGNHQQSKHYLMPSIFDSKKSFTKANYVLSWGKPKGLWQKKLDKLKINPVIVEDGFIRSVGLGVYFTPPLSLVFDKSGIYYDPNKPSDHEKLCLKKELTESEIKRTDLLIESIKQNQITKYNSEPFEKISFNTDKKIILVIGQVSNDQSIELGSKKYKDNLTFLQDIKASNENCFIVYKPHPDVLAKKRKGHIENARLFADKIITDINIISCIEASDEIHTMTSLSGFDALIRGKKVVTYGMPFYAGWGLTEDKLHLSRRNRKLDLKTLVHITLIDYPRYFDLESKSVITVEKAIEKIKLIRKKTSNTGQ